MLNNSSKNKNGFTLLELLVAAFVLIVGLIAALSLLQKSQLATSESFDRLLAAYLAQEGIEITRNLRDQNWLLQRQDPLIPWDQGIGEGSWEADYNDFSLSSWQDRFLKINEAGFYNYDSGQDTKFKRKITVQKPSPNILAITSQITWQERGKSYSLSVKENLYNWR